MLLRVANLFIPDPLKEKLDFASLFLGFILVIGMSPYSWTGDMGKRF